jgi:invasion protein IalB
MALVHEKENDKWVPLISLMCPAHNSELTSNDPEQEVRVWQCTVEGCTVRVAVKMDRERLKKLKLG